ncbi:putative Coiled-coil domain-containing protein [Helianthus annuus]|nr:putative Coiled-coil domain-containing protein [Helianthus annuus]
MGPLVKRIAELRKSTTQIRYLLSETRKSSSGVVPSNRRLYSGERVCYLDTLDLAKSLEADGFSAKQAESIASELAENFVSKAATQQSAAVHDARFSAFKWEMKCLQDNQLLMLKQECLKLKSDLEPKIQSLKRKLEKNHAELAAYEAAATAEMKNQCDMEIYKLKGRMDSWDAKLAAQLEGVMANVEAETYEVKKYCIGAIMSVGSLAIGAICMTASPPGAKDPDRLLAV